MTIPLRGAGGCQSRRIGCKRRSWAPQRHGSPTRACEFEHVLKAQTTQPPFALIKAPIAVVVSAGSRDHIAPTVCRPNCRDQSTTAAQHRRVAPRGCWSGREPVRRDRPRQRGGAATSYAGGCKAATKRTRTRESRDGGDVQRRPCKENGGGGRFLYTSTLA
jgi:hypothetical protein